MYQEQQTNGMTWLVSVARDINNKIYLQEKGRKIRENKLRRKGKTGL